MAAFEALRRAVVIQRVWRSIGFIPVTDACGDVNPEYSFTGGYLKYSVC